MIPIIGSVPKWRSMPGNPRPSWRLIEMETPEDNLVFEVWDQYFERYPLDMPSLYWSDKLRYADAQCFPFGIVISRRNYIRHARNRRLTWLRNVLKHELLHWAGYRHNHPKFKEFIREMGGSH